MITSSKEYVATFMRDNIDISGFGKRSRDYSISEARHIKEGSRQCSGQEEFNEYVRSNIKSDFENGPYVNLLAFASVKGSSVDVILPIHYSARYTALEELLVENCTDAGTGARLAKYEGLVNVSFEIPSKDINRALHEMSQIPSIFGACKVLASLETNHPRFPGLYKTQQEGNTIPMDQELVEATRKVMQKNRRIDIKPGWRDDPSRSQLLLALERLEKEGVVRRTYFSTEPRPDAKEEGNGYFKAVQNGISVQGLLNYVANEGIALVHHTKREGYPDSMIDGAVNAKYLARENGRLTITGFGLGHMNQHVQKDAGNGPAQENLSGVQENPSDNPQLKINA